MSSERLRAANTEDDDENTAVDMSPMIDLVFLLLIFFLVNSTLIIVPTDPKVKITLASAALTQKDKSGRFVVNIYAGTAISELNLDPDAPYQDARNNKLTLAELSDKLKEVNARNKARGVKTRLHLRADQDADMIHIKKVAQAAASAGVVDVLFANYPR